MPNESNDCENLKMTEEDWIRRQMEEKKAECEYLRQDIARLRGRIEGLEFAIRCNGISGGDVNI